MTSVLMLTTQFPPAHGGGAQQALRLCLKLADRGIQTSVLTAYTGRTVVKEQLLGIPVTRLPLSKDRTLLARYVLHIQKLTGWRRQYDLIHAHAVHHHAYAGFMAGRIFGKPAIAKMALLGHDDPAAIARRRHGRIQLKLLKLGYLLVAISQEMEQATLASGWPADKLVRIPNGVDTEIFRPLSSRARQEKRRQLGLDEEVVTIVYVGIIAPRKGIETLLKAWPQVQSARTKTKLLLVGPCSSEEHWGVDDSFVARLKMISGQQGTVDSVHFIGQTLAPENYFQAADIFVIPTSSEGMPNALLEAMSCGLPYVATDIGVIKEISPASQQRHLVPVGDVQALAEALITLADDRQERTELATAVRQTVESHYSLDAVADQYVALYHNLLK